MNHLCSMLIVFTLENFSNSISARGDLVFILDIVNYWVIAIFFSFHVYNPVSVDCTISFLQVRSRIRTTQNIRISCLMTLLRVD